jgi:hypothetical protein
LSVKENCSAILEHLEDLDTDSYNELDAIPLSQLMNQSLIHQFEVLAHLVQSDHNSLASVSKMIQTITGQARNGMSISAHFETSLGLTVSNKDTQRTPVNGNMHASSNVSGHNHLKSRHERGRDHSCLNCARASFVIMYPSECCLPTILII